MNSRKPSRFKNERNTAVLVTVNLNFNVFHVSRKPHIFIPFTTNLSGLVQANFEIKLSSFVVAYDLLH